MPYTDVFDTSDFSISLWAKISELNRDNFFFSIGDIGSKDRMIHLGVRGGTNNLTFAFYQDDFNNIKQMEADRWYHVVATFKRNTKSQEVYVDGVLEGSRTSSGVPIIKTGDATGDGMWIARYSSTYFKGIMDDVMIFSKALSEDEITALYANQSTKYLGVNFTSLSDGTYTFKAYSQDLAGNVNETEERTVVIGATNPELTITLPLNKTYSTSTIDFNVTGNEDLSSCKYTLDNWQTNVTMTSLNSTHFGHTNTSIADGSYIARFWCNDSTNNINAVSYTHLTLPTN